jgi:hypothetical protein
LSPKYRLALRLKNGKPHQSPSAQNRKIGSDCSFHASDPLENCSFNDRAGTRIKLSLTSREAFLDAVAHGSAVAWQHLNLKGPHILSEGLLDDRGKLLTPPTDRAQDQLRQPRVTGDFTAEQHPFTAEPLQA